MRLWLFGLFAILLSTQSQAFDFNSITSSDPDGSAWSDHKIKYSPDSLNTLILLANQSGHSKAKNYAGCIIASKTIDRGRLKSALDYFEAASSNNSLALYNSGLMLLRLGQNHEQAIAKIIKAYKKTGIEEAGAQILINGYRANQIDPLVLNEMLTLRSPIAFYLKSYLLYTQRRYAEALIYSSQGSEMGDVNSIGMQAKIYSALKDIDPANSRQSLAWGFIHKIVSNRDLSRTGLANGNSAEDIAWNDAVIWTSNHESRSYSYNEPVCESMKMVIRN